MSDLGPYNIRHSDPNGAEYRALQKLGMELETHADGKGFNLTIPRAKFFVTEAEPLAGMTGTIRIINEQKNGQPVARLYEGETIDLTNLSAWWTVAVEPAYLLAPSPPSRKTSHLRLVRKSEK